MSVENRLTIMLVDQFISWTAILEMILQYLEMTSLWLDIKFLQPLQVGSSWIFDAWVGFLSAPPGGQKIHHNIAQELHITLNSGNFNSTMVLTAALQLSFFEYDDQVGLSNRTRNLFLVLEGIATADDLADWYDDDWYQWNCNCKKLDTVQDANLVTQV